MTFQIRYTLLPIIPTAFDEMRFVADPILNAIILCTSSELIGQVDTGIKRGSGPSELNLHRRGAVFRRRWRSTASAVIGDLPRELLTRNAAAASGDAGCRSR